VDGKQLTGYDLPQPFKVPNKKEEEAKRHFCFIHSFSSSSSSWNKEDYCRGRQRSTTTTPFCMKRFQLNSNSPSKKKERREGEKDCGLVKNPLFDSFFFLFFIFLLLLSFSFPNEK
jgi:hypothetical protein